MVVIVRPALGLPGLDRTIQPFYLDSPIKSWNDTVREMFTHKFVADLSGTQSGTKSLTLNPRSDSFF